MKTTLAIFGIVTITVLPGPAARGADLRPMVVTALTGTLRVVQPIPCEGLVDRTTPVIGGRVELTPSEGLDLAGGGKRFSLTRANVTFAGFSVSGSCLALTRTNSYGEVRVQLARAVTFTALPTGAPKVFSLTIPRDFFQIDYDTTRDGTPDTGTKLARDDVTGTIDLATGTMRMRIVLATRVQFREGCVLDACLINETHDGSLTADITGTIVFPDSDGDGVPDRSDNCVYTANANQLSVATPTVAPPPPVTLPSCLSRGFGLATGIDVCDAGPVTVTSNAPAQFAPGANVVTWRAVDVSGRVANATQTVTVVDTTPPAFTFVPPDLTLNNCGPAALVSAAAADECAGTPAVSSDAPPAFSVGTTPVTWTARDTSGNMRTALQNVTVIDTTGPTVSCLPADPPGRTFRVSAADACAGAPVIRLGGYVLAEGERIMMNETGQPGVRFVNAVGADRIRHFQVGRGEGGISATDASGNISVVTCPVR